jgi:hypothetical protein
MLLVSKHSMPSPSSHPARRSVGYLLALSVSSVSLTPANKLILYVWTQAAYAEKIVDGWETVAEETSGYARGSDDAILGS